MNVDILEQVVTITEYYYSTLLEDTSSDAFLRKRPEKISLLNNTYLTATTPSDNH